MKALSILAVCLALSAAAGAQTFVNVAPMPTAADLSGVWFTSPTDGWVSGSRHTLLRTRDHGVTWTPVSMPMLGGDPLYDVTFATPTLGFVTGISADTGSDIYRTTDGGATWKNVTTFPVGGYWNHIEFASSTTGFFGSNGALLRTTDGGATFTVQSFYPDCPIIYGMRFLDASTGVVCGYQASTNQTGIFKTTDGGRTWRLKLAGYANDAVYLTSSTLISANGDQVIRSLDGGETWTPIATVSTGFSAFARVDANTIAGVSTGGDIWRSSNGGFTWSLMLKGVGDLPAVWQVRFLDNLNGHVVGQGGAIYETANGGITWTALNRGLARDWNCLIAFSDSDLLLGGFHGYTMSTTDSGDHWSANLVDPPSFLRDTSFSDMALLDPETAIVAGHWGSLFKTFDRGVTWVNLSDRVNPSYYPNGVKFTDASNGWMVGWDYNTGSKSYVRRTRDGGLSWQTVDAVNWPSMDVEFVGQNGWILSGGTGLYRTTDGGTTWRTIVLPLNSGIAPSTMQTAWGTASVGYIVGFDGYIVKSTDAGATWKQLGATNVGFVYLGVIARGTSEVWVCGGNQGGGNATVKRSLDGGATWQTWSLPGQYTMPYRMVQTAGHVYVVGYDGAVWRLATGASTVTLTGLSVAPSSVPGGQSSTGSVTLSGPAPAAGLVVALQSNNASAAVPASVTVTGGSSTATFNVKTSIVPAATTATISGALNGVSRSAALTITTAASDTVAVQNATFFRSSRQVYVAASSTSATAVLKVYVTSTGAYIGTLKYRGGLSYTGQFPWPVSPVNVTVKSSLGGVASKNVVLR